jgi:sulfur-carrier protein
MMQVRVTYYAGAAAAAGLTTEEVSVPPGATVAGLAEDLGRRHGPALDRVLSASSFLIDAVAGRRDRLLHDGAAVDVLPPFAGG